MGEMSMEQLSNYTRLNMGLNKLTQSGAAQDEFKLRGSGMNRS